MNVPVDALAVLREMQALVKFEFEGEGGSDLSGGMIARGQEAIDAVAELISYARRIEQRDRGMMWGDDDARAQDWASFRGALARVRGGVL